MRTKLSVPFQTARPMRLAGQLSLLALSAGLGAGCSMMPTREPIFTGSTTNQQQIIAGQATGTPLPSYSASAAAAGYGSSTIQGSTLPPPPGAATSAAPTAPAPYQPPKPFAAKGMPTPVGQVSSAAGSPSPTLVSMGSPPTTLNEQAAKADRKAGTSAGGSYTVQSGDTMYNIARRHGVSVDQLIAANGGSPVAKLGGKLKIPGGGSAPAVQVASVDPKSVPIPEPAPAPAAVASAAEIVPMAPPPVAQPVPGAPPAAIPPVASAPPVAAPPPVPATAAATPAPPPPGPELALAPQTASSAAAAPAAAQAANSAAGFRWPVRGRVISGFGKKPSGERNDGINLAVPEGTAVKAAEDGTVIYAGNELKSYGNLVLIRHANGWVSAYAHNSELKVKRGDQVRRGEVVSLSGMSGGVTTPQVHFELRKEATPVDPLQHMSES
jgi:murein DD-endopeptidase MepM/ murein hydrolase activator NlpD